MLVLPSDLGNTVFRLQPLAPSKYEQVLLPMTSHPPRGEIRSRQNLLFSFAHIAKAYAENPGIYSLTGLHSRYWAWEKREMFLIDDSDWNYREKWWLYAWGHISSLLSLASPFVKTSLTMASESFIQVYDSMSRRMTFESLLVSQAWPWPEQWLAECTFAHMQIWIIQEKRQYTILQHSVWNFESKNVLAY